MQVLPIADYNKVKTANMLTFNQTDGYVAFNKCKQVWAQTQQAAELLHTETL
jgi:hypothetical protein